MNLLEFQQLLKSELSFEQFMTMEKPKIESGKFTATIIHMGEFNAKGNMFAVGAFDQFLESKPTVPMFFQHDPTNYIGVWQNLRVEGDDLVGDGTLFVTQVQQAKEKAALIEQGYINRVSAGGEAQPEDVMWVERVNKQGKRMYGLVFNKASLAETSLVLRPGDEKAIIHQDLYSIGCDFFPQRGDVSVKQILDFTEPPARTEPEPEPERTQTPNPDTIETQQNNAINHKVVEPDLGVPDFMADVNF